MAEKEGKRRARPQGSGYLSRGRSRHKLFPSAGWSSPARCGTSPHWGDYVGWRGWEDDDEKEKLESLPWCGRCKNISSRDQLPPVKLAGGGVLH